MKKKSSKLQVRWESWNCEIARKFQFPENLFFFFAALYKACWQNKKSNYNNCYYCSTPCTSAAPPTHHMQVKWQFAVTLSCAVATLVFELGVSWLTVNDCWLLLAVDKWSEIQKVSYLLRRQTPLNSSICATSSLGFLLHLLECNWLQLVVWYERDQQKLLVVAK